MNTPTKQARRPLSQLDRGILMFHGLVAAAFGIVGFAGANDPEFGGLQRFLVVMLIGLWAGGIVGMAVIARLVNNEWARAVILLAGPFLGIVILVGASVW